MYNSIMKTSFINWKKTAFFFCESISQPRDDFEWKKKKRTKKPPFSILRQLPPFSGHFQVFPDVERLQLKSEGRRERTNF